MEPRIRVCKKKGDGEGSLASGGRSSFAFVDK